MKKRRQDYVALSPFEVNGFTFKILVDPAHILSIQGELTRMSKFGRNRQVYGPFKVTLEIEKAPTENKPKQKRTRRQVKET